MSRWNRRTFLRNLSLGAGASLLTPLCTRLVRADGNTPCRFVFIIEGNGFEPTTMLADSARAAIDGTASEAVATKRWWYRTYRHDAPLITTQNDLHTAPALTGLNAAPLVAEQAAVVLGLSSRISGGGHSASHGVLSCARTIAGVPGGQTIEAYLAAQASIRGDAPYDAVRLGVTGGNAPLDFGTCAFAKGRSAPLILNPTSAYNTLFGSVGSAAGRATFAKRRSLLDFARTDVQSTLTTFPGNSAERAKLESYLASVEQLTERHERLIALQTELEANQPATPDVNPLYNTGSPLDRFRSQIELVTAALKGSLTNVAAVGSGTGGNFNLTYSSVSPDVGRHDLHHGSAGSPEYRRRIHEVTRLQAQAIIDMANDLAATPEGDGTMLDNTVIVFVGDNGEQHHSTASEFPMLLLGGRGLGLKTEGRTVVLPGLSSSQHRQVSNVWNTLGHLAGQDLNEFGDEGPTRRAAGPLSELMI